MGRGEDSDVDRQLGDRADRADAPLFEDAQQARLEGGRHLADLVEQERAAVGGTKEAGAGLLGTGIGAPFDAEELRLEEGSGQGRAVEGDERTAGSPARSVDLSGDTLLARAALTVDPDRQIGACDALDPFV